MTKTLCHYTVVIDARLTSCPGLPAYADHIYKSLVAGRYDPIPDKLVNTTAQGRAHLFMHNQAVPGMAPDPTLGDGAQVHFVKCEVAGS